MSEPAWEDGQGWRVLDAAGNVIESGPPIVLEEHFGWLDEEDTDG